ACRHDRRAESSRSSDGGGARRLTEEASRWSALPGMGHERVAGEDRWTRILLLLLTAGALVPIWAAAIPPLQDLPNHLLKVDIFERWLRGEEGVRLLYALNLRPLANYTCYAILLLLSPFAGLLTGARILLSIIVTALPWSAYGFLRRGHPRGPPLPPPLPPPSFTLFLLVGTTHFRFRSSPS